jgi:chromosomal replication initiator protein
MEGVVEIPLPHGPQAGSQAAPFIAGPENRLVGPAVRAAAEATATRWNPLVIYGPSGTGKTHLAQGIAAAYRAAHRRRKVICTTAADYARDLTEAIDTQSVDEFRASHRGAAMLVIEDLGGLLRKHTSKLNVQEELIHTIDAMTAEDRWVVATSAVPPAELPGIVPALAGRLLAGLTIPLALPATAARKHLLMRLSAARGINLPDDVAEILATGLVAAAPQLAGMAMELAATTAISGGRLDRRTAKQYVAQRVNGRRPNLQTIATAVARHFGLRPAELRGAERRRELVAARGVAMYLARCRADMKLDQIGRFFGGRDHSTVLHCIRKTEQAILEDANVREAIEALRAELWKT